MRITDSANISRMVPETRCRIKDATKLVRRPVAHSGMFHIAA
jgi:hypothetical protein